MLKQKLLNKKSKLFFGLSTAILLASCGSSSNKETEWNTYGKDKTNQRYSTLDQINVSNAKDLTLLWEKDLGVQEAFEGTPIVADGVMYVTTPLGPKYVYAFDAKTGEEKWKKEFTIPQDFARYACCGLVNRGATYTNGKLFIGRLDGKLTCLDANTGNELWTVEVIDYKSGAVITSPPLIAGNNVVTGHGGGEYGTESRISAYDIETGKEAWKFFTVPKEDPKVVASWKGESYKVGGAAPWLVGSYDEATKTIFWGTSNPTPWNATLRGEDPAADGSIKHDNLYSASTLALDAETGKLKWHFQTTPFDAWDFDGVNEKVLMNLNINGKEEPVEVETSRNGFIYVINRNTGKLISADKFVDSVNWATGYNIETGRPIENPEFRTTTKKQHLKNMVWPSFIGGKNWQAMAYNPNTGLVYIPANNLGMTFDISEAMYNRGSFYLGAGWSIQPNNSPGEYIAWDVVNRKKVWTIKLPFPIPGGAATTKGNLLFFGDLTGHFYAYNATTGEKLWEYKSTSGIGAGAMTYEISGNQYVSVLEGRPTVIPGFIGNDLGKKMVAATPAGGKLLVFGLK